MGGEVGGAWWCKLSQCATIVLFLQFLEILTLCVCVTVVNGCYVYGFISAKTNGPYFGIESDMVC